MAQGRKQKWSKVLGGRARRLSMRTRAFSGDVRRQLQRQDSTVLTRVRKHHRSCFFPTSRVQRRYKMSSKRQVSSNKQAIHSPTQTSTMPSFSLLTSTTLSLFFLTAISTQAKQIICDQGGANVEGSDCIGASFQLLTRHANCGDEVLIPANGDSAQYGGCCASFQYNSPNGQPLPLNFSGVAADFVDGIRQCTRGQTNCGASSRRSGSGVREPAIRGRLAALGKRSSPWCRAVESANVVAEIGGTVVEFFSSDPHPGSTVPSTQDLEAAARTVADKILGGLQQDDAHGGAVGSLMVNALPLSGNWQHLLNVLEVARMDDEHVGGFLWAALDHFAHLSASVATEWAFYMVRRKSDGQDLAEISITN
ncbi:hypothetical protein R3P38DRAFT_3616264 [Favolaschia claudopus]|uniref:Uncharacterized protein n=1 Tax=Favolaschia claudopus TaxID=2862362 RepID=A0AAW0A3E1_9AGAR